MIGQALMLYCDGGSCAAWTDVVVFGELRRYRNLSFYNPQDFLEQIGSLQFKYGDLVTVVERLRWKIVGGKVFCPSCAKELKG